MACRADFTIRLLLSNASEGDNGGIGIFGQNWCECMGIMANGQGCSGGRLVAGTTMSMARLPPSIGGLLPGYTAEEEASSDETYMMIEITLYRSDMS